MILYRRHVRQRNDAPGRSARRFPFRRNSELSAGSALLGLSVLAALSLGVAPAQATFPGQNGRIACDGARGPAAPTNPPPAGFSRAEVYTMDPAGGAVQVLTSNTVDDLDPAWSPDGTKLSFDSLRDSSALDVYTMNFDGTGVRRLTAAPAEDRRTSWSPDGRIAFQAGRDTNFNIYTMNSDGSAQRGLTVDPTQDTQPAWSPDGRKIAYRSSRQGNATGDIFTMDPEVGETKDLTNVTNSAPPVGDFAPNFSPDSRQIAFQATGASGTLAIYRMNADGTGPATFLTTVTNEPGRRFSNNESNPAWSPDGTRIVFHSDRDRDPSSTDPALRDNVEVYTMNASDGSDVRRLTNAPGFDGRCDWTPVRSAAQPPTYYDVPNPTPPLAAACPAASSASVIRGSAAGNRLTGTLGADRILSAGGDDVVDALAGNDCVDLGTGADRGEGGPGGDQMVGGRGRDRVSGSAGNDRLRGGPGNDRLTAGRGNDRAFGDAGNDLILGSFGNDVLHGVGGSDRVSGSRGRDRINGGSGNDRIAGGSSGDRIAGDRGNDRLDGNSGSDRINGNSGNDRIGARDGKRDRINCGPGRDRVTADRSDRVARNCERVRRR